MTESRISGVIIATGISSVVTQLLIIREFLTQFSGNEFVIALIFFNWLVLGGVGTRLARLSGGRSLLPASTTGLVWLSLLAAALPVLLILTIRITRDIVFIHGSAAGFYPILAYTFLLTAPYAVLIGFALPYSLLILRCQKPSYPGTHVYITDNIGDIAGGALFSLAMVFLLTPMQAIFISNLPLLICTGLLLTAPKPNALDVGSRPFIAKIAQAAPFIVVLLILTGGLSLERTSLVLGNPGLVHYKESRYGRITVEHNDHQYTLRMDGIPIANTSNTRAAEEAVHYPLSQINDRVGDSLNILLISARAGILREIKKYNPAAVDYVEIDPHITAALFRYNMLARYSGITTINKDAMAFLRHTDRLYDAVITCLPEPDTFQLNRFYTTAFFTLVQDHLNTDGIFSFSANGIDNYLSETDRQTLSTLYNTAADRFSHVTMIPGASTFFLCASQPIITDIPRLLEEKGIQTRYIDRFYSGDVTSARINELASEIDPAAPRNHDIHPVLMKRMFADWFTTFDTSPALFYTTIAVFLLLSLLRVRTGTFVLFTTGFTNMAAELLTIFAFQIFFGYIYLQIGLIVTIFLTGLLPGAWMGQQCRKNPKRALMGLDVALIILIGLFTLAVCMAGSRVPMVVYMIFGFLVSCACGFQFPMILHWQGDTQKQAVSAFSADLIGAAFGALMISTIMIPSIGLPGAAIALILLKMLSLTVMGATHNATQHPL